MYDVYYTTSGGNWVNVWWHNVRLYNKILSSTQILHNYNTQKGRFGL
jgi:hypothetical protein